ncbi:MAG: OmpA family protein [Bdellovibrionota bacterium]
MKNTSLAFTALFTAALLSSCVSSGKHKAMMDDLESQIANEKSENQEHQKTIQDLEQKLMSTTKDRGQLRTNLEDMKKAMDEMKARQAEERKRIQEFQELTKRFKKLTDAGTLSVKVIDGKMVVSLGSDLLFSAGSAKLSKAGTEAVKAVTQQLNAIPGKKYQIEGHTDNVPISTAVFPSNWELASARAVTVVKTMVDNGMPSERVSAASYADTQPIQSNDTVEGKAANRRVAIVIVPDLSSLPGYDELQKASQ